MSPNKQQFSNDELQSSTNSDLEARAAALALEERELDLEIKIDTEFLTVEHSYPDFDITMHSFICSSKSDTLTLNEHVSSKWLSKEDLQSLDWAAADLPIVEKLIRN